MKKTVVLVRTPVCRHGLIFLHLNRYQFYHNALSPVICFFFVVVVFFVFFVLFCFVFFSPFLGWTPSEALKPLRGYEELNRAFYMGDSPGSMPFLYSSWYFCILIRAWSFYVYFSCQNHRVTVTNSWYVRWHAASEGRLNNYKGKPVLNGVGCWDRYR